MADLCGLSLVKQGRAGGIGGGGGASQIETQRSDGDGLVCLNRLYANTRAEDSGIKVSQVQVYKVGECWTKKAFSELIQIP